MPALEPPASQAGNAAEGGLRFPPVTRDHILHCSYDYWFPKYRTSCIRSRIIPLTPDFISWLQEDGIVLADEDEDANDEDDNDDWEPSFSPSAYPPPQHPDPSPESDSDTEDDESSPPTRQPPNLRFPALHAEITAAIAALGGAAAPKLNWSSPKDATWISRHPNTMKCTSANDVYVLLKSSSFISHDLNHAFDDTVPPLSPAATQPDNSTSKPSPVPPLPPPPPPPPPPPQQQQQRRRTPPREFTPVLVLRTFFNPLPSLEFRCFVKDRSLVAITQRDMNYYAFLAALRPQIVLRARELFAKMRLTFPDACFVFDVYIPEADYGEDEEQGEDEDVGESGEHRAKTPKLGRARLIDINPWAPRTDTLLFDWGELLGMEVARPLLGSASTSDTQAAAAGEEEGGGDDLGEDDDDEEDDEDDDDDDDEEEEEEEGQPELRLVERDDPAAYNFNSPQYSAHKLPKDVVDASMAGEGGMREFAQQWQRIVEGRER